VATYEPGDGDGLAAAILALVDDPAGRDAAVSRTRTRIGELSWDHEADRLWALIDRLAVDRISSSA
jgi:glycosyltransferase involved in cell wall biosynthesis